MQGENNQLTLTQDWSKLELPAWMLELPKMDIKTIDATVFPRYIKI